MQNLLTILAVITAVAVAGSSIVSLVFTIINHGINEQNRELGKQTHALVNSRMTELLETVKRLAHADGVADEKKSAAGNGG
jgi:hypothetical protein